ncbi:MAG: ABC transporter permease [Flavobacteriaceae bacterium]|nr:ABC transporter permease [Flavobacteriaceae bacterium]
MNYESFIARKLVTTKKGKDSVSSPIIKIAITAITISLVIMILTISTGVGLQNEIRDKLTSFKGHVVISSYDNNLTETSSPIDGSRSFDEDFKEIKGIKDIQPFANKTGIIRTEETFEGVVFKGVSSTYNWAKINSFVKQGRFPIIEKGKASKEILISKYLSDRLGLLLGDKVIMDFLKKDVRKLPNRRIFTLVGIYNSGVEEFDKNIVIGDIKHIVKMNKWDENQIGGFEVTLDEFDDITEIGSQIYSRTGSTLNSNTIKELFPTIFNWLKMFDTNIVIILFIMMLVAGVNIITVLLVLVLEKTNTIGLLKILGANNSSIRKIFIYQTLYIVGKGLVFGNIIGLSLVFIQKYFAPIKLNPELYYVDKAPIYIDFSYIMLLNIATIVLCAVFILIPSYIISTIKPAVSVKAN